MIFGKYILAAFVAVLALTTVTEAGRHKKHRKEGKNKKWQKLVHHKCLNDGDVMIALAGELKLQNMRLALRYDHFKNTNLVFFINGKDLVKPGKAHHKKRNVEFVRANKDKFTFGVLPWADIEASASRKTMLKQFDKSAAAMTAVMEMQPLLALVGDNIAEDKKAVKAFSKAGYVLVNGDKAQHDALEGKTLTKGRFLYIQAGGNVNQLSNAIDRIDGALLTPADAAVCFGTPVFGKLSEDALAKLTKKSKKSSKKSSKKHRKHRKHSSSDSSDSTSTSSTSDSSSTSSSSSSSSSTSSSSSDSSSSSTSDSSSSSSTSSSSSSSSSSDSSDSSSGSSSSTSTSD